MFLSWQVGRAPFMPATNVHHLIPRNIKRLRHEIRAEPNVGQADNSTCCVKLNKLHNSDRAESENHCENTKTEHGDIYPQAYWTSKRVQSRCKISFASAQARPHSLLFKGSYPTGNDTKLPKLAATRQHEISEGRAAAAGCQSSKRC